MGCGKFINIHRNTLNVSLVNMIKGSFYAFQKVYLDQKAFDK